MKMRTSTRLLTVTAALICSATFALAQSVTTDPVGFETTTVGSGKIGALSLPLDNIADFAAAANTVTSTTIQTTGAAFTANKFAPLSTNPHIVRVLTGTGSGRQYKITSHTTDTLTVTPAITGTVLTYEIMAVRTLGSFFGATAPSLNRNANPSLADNVQLRGSSGYLTYYNEGAKWLLVGGDGETPEDNTPLFPENGLLLVRRVSSALPVTVTGAVPMSNLVTDLPASKITLLANRFPTDTTLVGLGLQSLVGWNSNVSPSAADNVLLRGSSGYLTYYYDGTKWLLVGGDGETAENPTIAIGTSVVVVRRAGSPVVLNQAKPY